MQNNANFSTPNTDDLAAVNDVIVAFILRKSRNAADISPYYRDLWTEIARLAGSGGKRLRSRLVLLSYRAFGGTNTNSILPAAAAMELLHQGMLIHDDIIDRDYVRYGVDNIAGQYDTNYATLVNNESDRLHYAQSAALLAGDLMLSESYLLMSETEVPAEKIIAIQKLLNQSIFEVIGGELLDTEGAFRDSNSISPEVVALYKTASYTFCLPLLVGATLAGATDEHQNYIKEFARNLGIAFQLRDDIIGIFGDESKTGKSSSSDIREGKHTYMVQQLYALASDEQKDTFDAVFGRNDSSDDEIESTRQLLRDTGALEANEKAISAYEQKARDAWGKIGAESSLQSQVDDLINVATKRRA